MMQDKFLSKMDSKGFDRDILRKLIESKGLPELNAELIPRIMKNLNNYKNPLLKQEEKPEENQVQKFDPQDHLQ